MNDSFFGKNGTMQGALNVASDIGAHSISPYDIKTGMLSSIVHFVKSLLMV